MIEKIEITTTSGDVHNFKKGEFSVEAIEIDELRGLIEISYGLTEGGKKYVLIPIQNVEKCEFLDKEITTPNDTSIKTNVKTD
ncbi:MAG: hypothetical protein F8N15_10820 [Methanobacterium sp.]|nr:hypothetical protein [Methanobacterium sp.]